MSDDYSHDLTCESVIRSFDGSPDAQLLVAKAIRNPARRDPAVESAYAAKAQMAGTRTATH